jgi:hypothetical protein
MGLRAARERGEDLTTHGGEQMQRKSSPANPELDALLEERVDLQVRLVVLAESAHPDRPDGSNENWPRWIGQ